MRKITLLAVVVSIVTTLACSGTDRSEECALPADANGCEKCLHAACEQACIDCVNDDACYECTEAEAPSDDCLKNEKVGLLITCILGADCVDECTAEPSRKKRQRVGKGKKGGDAGKTKKGGGEDEGKAGKGDDGEGKGKKGG